MDEIMSGEKELSDEEALLKIADAMKGNTPSLEDKQNVFTFLFNVATAKDTTKIANLRDDREMNELGNPCYTVRGSKEMSLISDKIMENEYFKSYFDCESENTLATSLSRGGFLVRQSSTQTKQVADVTRRRKINKGWFGKENVEESGGDTNQLNSGGR
jgi:hypothetical protein